jgi:hypothetical protein
MSQVSDKLYHTELTTLVVIDTYYTGSCQSNYHTTTTAPLRMSCIFSFNTKHVGQNSEAILNSTYNSRRQTI